MRLVGSFASHLKKRWPWWHQKSAVCKKVVMVIITNKWWVTMVELLKCTNCILGLIVMTMLKEVGAEEKNFDCSRLWP